MNVLSHFLDAIVTPNDYQNLLLDDENWNWYGEATAKAQGLKAFLSSFQSIVVFIITKNVLNEVKPLASKFQKQDQDIVETYRRTGDNIDEIFSSWYNSEILPVADNVGVSSVFQERQAFNGIVLISQVLAHWIITKEQLLSHC